MTYRPNVAAQYLQETINVLEENGWCQHKASEYNYETGETSYCLTGAMRSAGDKLYPAKLVDGADDSFLRYLSAKNLTMAYLAEFIKLDPEMPFSSLADWNDQDGRTKDEVLTLLRKALDDARTQHS